MTRLGEYQRKKKMVEAMELLVIVMGILATTSTLASAAPPLAKPYCQSQCGDLSIPFPFGIGSSNCYLDKWFEIVCDNSTTPHRTFLKSFQQEVHNISLDDGYFSEQWIQVNSPIFFNCTNKISRKPIDLRGSPFYYLYYNNFVAVGCGTTARMESRSGNMFSQIGCTSNCSSSDQNSTNLSNTNFSYDGVGYCNTSIPSTMDSTFEIFLENTNESQNDECKFAFLVDENYWYNNYRNATASSLMKFRNLDYVPVLLGWWVNHTYFDCSNSTSLTTYTNSPLDSCHCKYGFRGNPYLIDGCQDINECDEQKPCSGGICLNTDGSYRCSYKRKFVFIGIGSALGALVLLFALWVLYKVIKKRREIKRKKKFFKRNGGLLLEQQISSGENNVEKTKLFNSNELEKATDHFSIDRILGQGGQGTVYKGMLEDGKIVAVKKSKIIDEAKLSEFINEVVILSQINHRNIVKLLGCCLETEVPLLVYEFIPNGTLSEYIHERNAEFPLTWKMLLRIASEVAGALSYLHSAASYPIYHRDIKSSNILLDEKYRAKVADFGTSRTIALEQTHLTTLVYGTFGYLDPEYFQSSQFTEKSDVYSFGVVLVELLTGQKAISITRSEEGRSLATYFIMTMEEDGLFNILDAQVLEDAPKEEIIRVAYLAQRCLHLNGRNRPTMKEVAMELEGIQRPDGVSNVQENHELEYVRTELVEPWDVVSTSTGSALDNSTTRSSLLQELPLLSFESR